MMVLQSKVVRLLVHFFLSLGCAVVFIFDIHTVYAQGQEEEVAIEEVLVLGIRKSLESAMAEKRERTNLTEVINAEDVGKLPDENVAEVLENIPGVQITRSAGIGEGVSVRGSDENRVEINGRGTLSTQDDRGGIRFSDLPAALVRSLTVVKVPTADMVEGSIGGTINVKTYRGLRLKKPLKVARFTSEYAENSDAWNENAALTWGDKFNTEFGDIGAILTFSHIKKSVREDSIRVSTATRTGTGGNNSPALLALFPPVGEGSFTPYYYPGFGDTQYGEEDRENNSLNGSLEWQATSKLKLFMEGTYTDVERLNRRQSALQSFGSGSPASSRELDGLRNATFDTVFVAGVQIPIFTSGIIGGGVRNGTTIDGVNPNPGLPDGLQIRTTNRTTTVNSESYVAALGGEWKNDTVLIEFEVNAAASKRKSNAFNVAFQYNDPSDPNFHSLDARLRVPFIYDVRDGDLSYGPVPGHPAAANFLNPDFYSLFVARDTTTRFENDAYAQKIDLTWTVDTRFWSDLRFGLRTSQRSTERLREAQTTDLFPFGAGSEFTEIDLSGFLTSTPGNFLEYNSDGVFLDNFLTPDYRQVSTLRSVLESGAGLGGNNRFSPPQGFRVEEDTFAMYASADFYADILGMPLRGNIGLRVIQTNQLATGNQLQDSGVFNPVSVRQEYTNALPSASLVLSPFEKVQIRFGYAEILRRPSFAQLSPTFEFPLNVGQAVIVGDPSLRPTTAEQYDLAVEYYFRKGSVLSLGVFHKELESVVGRVRDGQICSPIAVSDNPLNCPTVVGGPVDGTNVPKAVFTNLEGGKIQGAELAFQHRFNWLPKPYNGLGVIASYAYQDGERDLTFSVPGFLQGASGPDAEFPLNFTRLSENSYNVTVYFERPKSRWSGRLRYTYRDGFLVSESVDASNNLPLYRDDRFQLNASMSYRLTDVFTLRFSGVNLTKEQSTERSSFTTGPIVRQRDADRRMSLGISGRF